MAFNPDDFEVKPIGDAGLTERTVLDGTERLLVQPGADQYTDRTPMQFVKYQTIQAKIDTLKGTGWAGQTVKGNATAIALNTPPGIIVMWSGLISAIPAGWFLCNGLNGTPDLRGRFIYGASIDADVKTTGGSANAIVVSHTHTGPAHTHTSASHTHSTPNHTHTASSNSTGSHNHGYTGKEGIGCPDGSADTINVGHGRSYPRVTQLNDKGAHSHTITVNSGGASTTGSTTPGATGSSGTGNTGSTGSSGTNANLPPYMKLAYIMKG